MRKAILAAAVATLASIAAPLAADLSPYQPMDENFAAPFSWSGFYAGATIGYGWGTTDVFAMFPESPETRGVIGGVHLGYNHELDGFVLGAEVDVSLSDIHHSEPFLFGTSTVGVENFASLRARAGVAIDRLMPYVTGGLALGTGSFEVDLFGTHEVVKQTHIGWTLGAGVEYAVTDKLIARAEYIYTDFGKANYGSDLILPFEAKMNFGAVRAGFSVKF